MDKFSDLKSVKRLKELAKKPIDFSKKDTLTPQRIHSMIAEGLGFKLFYGTERVDDAVLAALFDLVKETEAIEKIQSMQAGEVVNVIEGYPSENRPALHTAMRDFFDHRETTLRAWV